MRAVGLLTTSLLAGCASLLGLEDPRPRSDGGPPDAPEADGAQPDGGEGTDHLVFSVASLRIARNQTALLHVQFNHLDGSSEDVTASATYGSDAPDVATASAGRIVAGAAAGVATITASFGTAAQASLPVTVTATLCHPVINELMTASNLSQDDEWVEIYNPCNDAIDVAGWTLNYRSATNTGASDGLRMVTLTGQLAAGELRLFAGPDYTGTSDGGWAGGTLAQANGGVGLRAGAMTTAPLVDSIAYGNVSDGHPFIEGTRAPAMITGRSGARLPFDGKDDGDGATDFTSVLIATPHALNAP